MAESERGSHHRRLAEAVVRTTFAVLALGTVALGLFVHFGGGAFGATTRDVVGDALWAAMIAWLIGAISPRTPLRVRAAAALLACFAVEASQLLHVPALDAIRSTTAGHLVLGSGFDPRDFVAYALGVAVAVVIERLAITR